MANKLQHTHILFHISPASPSSKVSIQIVLNTNMVYSKIPASGQLAHRNEYTQKSSLGIL